MTTSVQPKLNFKVKKNLQNNMPVIKFYSKSVDDENMPDKAISKRSSLRKCSPVKIDLTYCSGQKRINQNDNGECPVEDGSPPKRDRSSNSSTGLTPHLDTKLHISCSKKLNDINTCGNNHLAPKKLFQSGTDYQQARKAFSSSAQKDLPGREEQLEQFENYLLSHLEDKKSGTLYVSGPPGTGKTACLTKIMEIPKIAEGYKVVYINCTTMKSSHSVYAKICSELKLKVAKKSEKEYTKAIEKSVTLGSKMILLILDEIDQLDSKNQSVLYTIFEWPSKLNSKLALIGIANALDLTDRILPRLQARLDLKPKLVHFPPYTKQQIIDILTKRLQQQNVNHIFAPATLHLLAAKVSSVSGDVRRALDIGRRVLELAESKNTNDIMPLQPTTDHCINTSIPRKPRNLANTSTVDLKLVMDTLNNVYGTSQALSEENDAFPIQQKVLVCTLLLMMKNGPSKDVALGKLHEVYRRICSKRNLLALDQSEFKSMCQMLEIRGIVRIQGRKEIRQAKVCLQWDEDEVATALKDKQLLSTILSDVSILSK